MKRISNIGNLPKPVQAFVRTEAIANMYVRGALTGGEDIDGKMNDFMPEVWEANTYDELKQIIRGETDLVHEILIDKECDRYFFTSVGSSGRIKFTGTWEVDEVGIDAQQSIAENGIIVFAEIALEEARLIMGSGLPKE